MCLRACLQVKFLLKRLGKIITHVTCKAYLTVNADRLPKCNLHRVITDGESGTHQTVKPGRLSPGTKSLNVRVDETMVQGSN